MCMLKRGDNLKILVVDDEVNIRNVIKEYAKFEGYEVEEAGNGMQAVEICKEKDFDMMPKLDGFSAIKEIRKTKNIPVLMLSARGEEYDKLFGFEIGIDDYVVKPFSPKEVMARVAAITSRVKNNSKAKKEDKYARKSCCSRWREKGTNTKRIRLTCIFN